MSRMLAVGAAVALTLAAVAGGSVRAAPGASDVQKFTGNASVSSPGSVSFTTMANENGVILGFEGRNGGERTLRVYDSSNTLVTTIMVPAGVTSVWNTYIPGLRPSSSYRVSVSVSSGQTRFIVWVNHCPNGQCF